MISELYLKRAFLIKKEYLDILTNIKKNEEIYKGILNSLDKATNDSEKLLDDINSNRITNIDSAQKELFNIMNNLEVEMMKVDKSINSLNNRILELSEIEKELYQDIKDKYDMEDSVIRDLINSYIEKRI